MNTTLLIPTPAMVGRLHGRFRVPSRLTFHAASTPGHAAVCRRELAAVPANGPAAAHVRLLEAACAPRDLRTWCATAEGYALRIAQDGIDIWASSGAGHLYGVMTLRQLRRQFGDVLPCLTIGDAPRLARRGIQLCFPQGHTVYRHAYMKHLVPALARLKINELYLYLESYFDFPSLPHMAGPGAMTPDEARDLDRLCRDYHVTLIPMLNTLAHCGEILATQRYKHLVEYRAGEDPRKVRPFNLCATSKGTERLVDGMLDDLCACFTADTFHIGGDEVSCLGECPVCLKAGADKPLALYLRYFGRILNKLANQGKRGGIWGDMLLHYAPNLSGAESRKVFGGLRDKAILYDWNYGGGSPKTLDFFAKARLMTIACSSSHLCYSSAMWPSQSVNQRALFLDAIAAGAAGGMTTAWGNFTGLHEEQFSYLQATGAALLWSGAVEGKLTGALDMDDFDAAYSLQRHDVRDTAFTDYLHAVGDAGGAILQWLRPQHGLDLRKCLYHTDNPLLFWEHYSTILTAKTCGRYAAAIATTRRLWDRAQAAAGGADRYFWIHEGPLLMHEHLLARYRMTEVLYKLYDQAARIQYEKPAGFRKLLDQAAAVLLGHLADFAPVDAYLAKGHRRVGFDRSTLNRIAATRKNIRYLADFLRHLKASHRPLPAFHELHGFLMSQFETSWYGDREHEWAAETPRFRRYSVTSRGVNGSVVADASKERFRPRKTDSDFVGGWRLSPIASSARLVSAACPAGNERRWPRLEARGDGFINVHDVTGDRDGLVYLARRFSVERVGAWRLQLGHDGGAKVFVDGEPVLCQALCSNPANPDRSSVRVDLKPGVHKVVVALDLCRGRGWGIFFRWSVVGRGGGRAPSFPTPVG